MENLPTTMGEMVEAKTDIKLPIGIVVVFMLIFFIVHSIILYVLSISVGYGEVTLLKAVVISGYLAFSVSLTYVIMYFLRQGGRLASAYLVGLLLVIVVLSGAVYLMSNYYNLLYSSAFINLIFTIFVSGIITYILVIVVMVGYMGWFLPDASSPKGGIGNSGTGYK